MTPGPAYTLAIRADEDRTFNVAARRVLAARGNQQRTRRAGGRSKTGCCEDARRALAQIAVGQVENAGRDDDKCGDDAQQWVCITHNENSFCSGLAPLDSRSLRRDNDPLWALLNETRGQSLKFEANR